MHRDQEVLALPPRVYPTVDLRQDGVQHGFLKVPHSNDASAWGAVMVPIAVIHELNDTGQQARCDAVMVKRCDVIAHVHDVTRTGVAPVEYRARRDGMLIGRHFPGRVGIGDTLCVLADVLPSA